MSLDQIRKLRLLKKLDQDSRVYSKSEVKRKPSVNISMTENLRKINKNKKYMLEEERNTEIQRNNRMLYQKIMGHFKTLKETQKSIMVSRHKWRKRKNKQINTNDEQSQSSIKLLSKAQNQKDVSRLLTQRQSHHQANKTLFYGNGQIDGITLKIKIMLTRFSYFLLARNNNISIQLQMKFEQYMRLHNKELGGNPCNIFKYLEIVNNQVRFRQKLAPLKASRQSDRMKSVF